MFVGEPVELWSPRSHPPEDRGQIRTQGPGSRGDPATHYRASSGLFLPPRAFVVSPRGQAAGPSGLHSHK